MKGNRGRIRGKKVLSLMLAITLSMSQATAMGIVEAEESGNISVLNIGEEMENTNVLPVNEETGDLSIVTETGQSVEDKEYVVYIEVSDEAQSVADEENSNTISEKVNTADYSNSEMTVSENVMSKEAVITNEDKTIEFGAKGNEPEKTAEYIQESIEKAEELILEQADGQEVVKDEEIIIYATNLNLEQIETLKESDAIIYVEENIELFGAKSKADKNEKKGKSDKKSNDTGMKEKVSRNSDEKQEEADIMEKKLTYKKSLSEVQKEEPEWNIQMINADGLEKVPNKAIYNTAKESTGDSVKIAVMDSGIELLSGIPVQEIVNLVPDEQDLPYYMNDMTGHGTAVAGIINDIAPNAEIYSGKIMDAENKATLTRVVEGIYWCIENDIDIINMSFGTQAESQIFKKAVEDANKAGILIVSSAGNGGMEGVEYPAAFEEVIAVGAVDTLAQKTEESAVGEEVELVAPGEEIISDSMLGLQTVVSGTSMAAPHVTAAAAVLWQKDKTKSPEFIRGLLSQAAIHLGDAEEYGNGLVDLSYALEHYEEYAAEYQEVAAEETTTEHAKESTDIPQSVEEMTAVQEETTDPVVSGTKLTEEMLIEENETPVETFEDVDYVEGRWGGEKGHLKLVDDANAELDFLDPIEVEIFKLGAVYPDKVFKVKDDPTGTKGNKNWHGGVAENYIANYRFATRMAKYAGGVERYQRAKGQSEECYNQMVSKISNTHVGGRLYENIINFTYDDLVYCYSSQTAGEKMRWRKIFLYGMASHIVTDTFAHSAYYKKDGKYVKIAHPEADKQTYIKERFADAKEAMSCVIINYIEPSIMGSEIDFSPETKYWGKNRGYYLKNLLEYARKAAVDSTETELLKMFKAINID